MTHKVRHFNALSRKNFIIWRRNPICSALEIIFPPLLFLLLVYLRSLINVKHVDFVSIEKYKHPVFPALKIEKQKWSFDPDYINETTGPFMNYAGYTPTPPIPVGSLDSDSEQKSNAESNKDQLSTPEIKKDPSEEQRKTNGNDKVYNEKGDWMGPLYFMPD